MKLIWVKCSNWKLKTHLFFNKEMYIFMRPWPTLILYSYLVFPEGGVRGKLHQNRDEKKNLHFFSPEYGCECDHIFTKLLALYILYISFSILSMWRWLRDWHLFFWDLYFGGEMPTKHDLAAPYSTEMWQVPYEIILKLL